jgi:hypothetical protein
MFGEYPVSNVRFAEQEALASRIYTNDLQKLSEPNNNWQTIDISEFKDANNTFREVAKLNIQSDGKFIKALKLLDSKERLIKSIMYEYSTENGTSFLKRQNIELAERPFLMGFNTGGIKVSMNGQERMIKEVLSTHHAGSRKCTVDYQKMKIGDKLISLPVNMAVYSSDGKNILCTSRLMNFKQVELNKDNTDKSKKDSASFDENEKQVREMLLKYWMKNPEKIEKEDLIKMRQIQKHFEDLTVKDFAGDQLRRINMLLQIDWILGDRENLPKHYQQYLNILKTNKMEQMLLYAGQQVIETTYRWNYYPSAYELLKQWLDVTLSLNNPDLILNFAKNAIEKDRFWETSKLLDKSLDSHKVPVQKQIYAEYLRCAALYGLYQMLQSPDKIPDGRKKEQANWVLSKTSKEELLKTLNKDIGIAQKAFSSIENPDDEVKALKKQIDEMSKKLNNLETQDKQE